VTASRYPFPTVCADKQSTDWFHAISRTLKWNERERQKSFVVVEEGPMKSKKKSRRRSTTADRPRHVVKVTGPELAEETLEDEEEDEVSDDEQDEKFDIDDSSAESSHGVPSMNDGSSSNQSPSTRRSKSQTRSGLRSGDARSRFPASHPRPPRNVRHNDVGVHTSPRYSESSIESPHYGSRDDIRTSRAAQLSGRSRIPKDRHPDLEPVTPSTASETRPGRRLHSPTPEHHHPRAFAAWGQDESDSNASESENDLYG
jgi:NAD+ kinase